MPITIDIPPAIVQEAMAFAQSRNTTFEQMVVDCLDAELRRRREAQSAISRLDAIAERVNAKLSGEPYKFNRADAYPEDVFA